jgi:hypothetical protein
LGGVIFFHFPSQCVSLSHSSPAGRSSFTGAVSTGPYLSRPSFFSGSVFVSRVSGVIQLPSILSLAILWVYCGGLFCLVLIRFEGEKSVFCWLVLVIFLVLIVGWCWLGCLQEQKNIGLKRGGPALKRKTFLRSRLSWHNPSCVSLYLFLSLTRTLLPRICLTVFEDII